MIIGEEIRIDFGLGVGDEITGDSGFSFFSIIALGSTVVNKEIGELIFDVVSFFLGNSTI